MNQQPQPLQAQSTNPFANTRFASTSHTTAFTLIMDQFNHNSSNNNNQKIQANATGNNPFKVSQTTLQLFDNYALTQQQNQHQQLKPQATAGGLEHLPTIPVFPDPTRSSKTILLSKCPNWAIQPSIPTTTTTAAATATKCNNITIMMVQA